MRHHDNLPVVLLVMKKGQGNGRCVVPGPGPEAPAARIDTESSRD